MRQQSCVAYWHLADVPEQPVNVRYWGEDQTSCRAVERSGNDPSETWAPQKAATTFRRELLSFRLWWLPVNWLGAAYAADC